MHQIHTLVKQLNDNRIAPWHGTPRNFNPPPCGKLILKGSYFRLVCKKKVGIGLVSDNEC